MATMTVKNAAGGDEVVEKPLAPGRAAASASRPIALSTEDAALFTGMQGVEDAAAAANPTGIIHALVRKDTPASEVTADGDYVARRGDAFGAAYTKSLDEDGAVIPAPALDASGNAKAALVGADGQALEYLEPLSTFSAKGQNAMSASFEQILAANPNRIGLEIINMDASIAVYVGDSAAVTTANGFPIAPGGLTATASPLARYTRFDYGGPIFGIAPSGTPNVAYQEW